MSEQLTAAQQVVLAAASMAGPVGSNPGAWRNRMLESIPLIASIVSGDRSREVHAAERILDPDGIITTHYGGYEIEESSTRCIIRFINEDGSPQMQDDHQEEIRTDRTDSVLGRATKKTLDGLEVGQRILIWKEIEEIGPNKKVRVAAHVQPIGAPPSGKRERPQTEHVTRQPPPQPDAKASLQAEDISTKVRTIMSKLSPAGNARWFAEAKKAGIDIDNCPADRFAEARQIALKLHAEGFGASEPQPIPPEEEESF